MPEDESYSRQNDETGETLFRHPANKFGKTGHIFNQLLFHTVVGEMPLFEYTVSVHPAGTASAAAFSRPALNECFLRLPEISAIVIISVMFQIRLSKNGDRIIIFPSKCTGAIG
jgi:hypothetical protein